MKMSILLVLLLFLAVPGSISSSELQQIPAEVGQRYQQSEVSYEPALRLDRDCSGFQR